MKIKYNLVSVEKIGKNTIILIGRDEKGERKVFRIKDFFPYFFVPHGSEIPTKDTADEEGSIIRSERDHRIKSVEELVGFSLDSDVPLDKITLYDLRDTPDVRQLFEKTYEADVMFALRFKIDKGIKQGFMIDKKYINRQYISEKHVEGF